MTDKREKELLSQIKDLQDLNARTRFKKSLVEIELENYKARTSRFVNITLDILLGLHIPFEVILLLYKEKDEH